MEILAYVAFGIIIALAIGWIGLELRSQTR
jgi:hypothetical protein